MRLTFEIVTKIALMCFESDPNYVHRGAIGKKLRELQSIYSCQELLQLPPQAKV
jgi:hypothetical protein